MCQINQNFSKEIWFFLRFYLFILDSGREGEREGERHQCVVASCEPPTWDLTWSATQTCALTGNQTSDPLVLRLVLNPLSHTSQGRKFVKEKVNNSTVGIKICQKTLRVTLECLKF